MPNIGPLELIILLVILLLIFGARRVPELGRSLGRGMREFKDSVTGKDRAQEPPAELPAARSETVRSADRTDEAETVVPSDDGMGARSRPSSSKRE